MSWSTNSISKFCLLFAILSALDLCFSRVLSKARRTTVESNQAPRPLLLPMYRAKDIPMSFIRDREAAFRGKHSARPHSNFGCCRSKNPTRYEQLYEQLSYCQKNQLGKELLVDTSTSSAEDCTLVEASADYLSVLGSNDTTQLSMRYPDTVSNLVPPRTVMEPMSKLDTFKDFDIQRRKFDSILGDFLVQYRESNLKFINESNIRRSGVFADKESSAKQHISNTMRFRKCKSSSDLYHPSRI